MEKRQKYRGTGMSFREGDRLASLDVETRCRGSVVQVQDSCGSSAATDVVEHYREKACQMRMICGGPNLKWPSNEAVEVVQDQDQNPPCIGPFLLADERSSIFSNTTAHRTRSFHEPRRTRVGDGQRCRECR